MKDIAIHQSRFEETRRAITNYIIKHELKDGDRLPAIAELAYQMNVSQTIVREVLRTLESIDMLQIVNGRGVFIRQSEKLKSDYSVTFELDRRYILDLIELRAVLDRYAIELVITHATDDEIDLLETAARNLMVSYYSGRYEVKADHAFHKALYRISHNHALESFLDMYYKAFSVQWDSQPMILESAMESVLWHWDVFTAIKDRQLDDALRMNNRILEHTIATNKKLSESGIRAMGNVDAALSYIDTHLADPISLETLSSFVGLERTYFSKLFHRQTGMTLQNYIINLRMDTAQKLLQAGQLHVKEVGARVGIQDPYYFSKLFKKVKGVPPSACM